MSATDPIRAAVRDVPDFPKPGIIFKDITPILSDATLFQQTITEFCNAIGDAKVDKVVGIDARGFIFGAAVADRLKAGFVPIRKKGKLPWQTHQLSYSLEYGEATIELHKDAITPGESVLLVDDLLATGGTCGAAVELLQHLDAKLIGIYFLIELSFLNGRKKLPEHLIHSIITY